jgi:hypothetical protein
MVILTNNHKKEDNISLTFCQVFTKKEGNVTKSSDHLSKIFGSLGGKIEW